MGGSRKQLGEVANGVTLADGTCSITIKRGLLHRALRDEAVRRGIRIEAASVSWRSTRVGGLRAHFADGSHARADVLVGADGVHSRARAIVDASAPKPRYTGQLSLGGIVCNPRVAPTPGAYHMMFGTRAFFGYSARPSGEIYWFANVARRDEPRRSELSSITAHAWKVQLLDLFADDAGPATMILEHAGDELGAYPIYDMPTVRPGITVQSCSSGTPHTRPPRARARVRRSPLKTPSCWRSVSATSLSETPHSRPTNGSAGTGSKRS